MILWNAHLIDGAGGAPLSSAMVRIEGDRIAEVGVAAGPAPPAAINLGGRTLLPGLIDAHCHLYSDVSRSPGFGPPDPQMWG